MKVMIDNQREQILTPTLEALDNWWVKTTADIFQNERLIYLVEINGESMFSNYEQYIIDNIGNIQNINIRTFSRAESIEDTERSLDEYIDRFLVASLQISGNFYGDLSENHWNEFSDFITGLDWIIKALEFDRLLVQQELGSIPDYLSILDILESNIVDMEKNLESKDYVAVGDIIEYEMIPALRNFRMRHKQ
ncbi:hypothetical protein P9847_14105 [Paenibacillus chibensis]|uniref:Uncharacterized protein n=1 Tax=Paenibacillus chibensis TaxID=59846 RepID=A0ABU6PWE8_9BACL|nr:hypothetical protein [Paenibacillus chibensis]